MYDWRKMDRNEKKRVLEARYRNGHAAHELPHFSDGTPGIFFITGSNYLHKPIIGKSTNRMDTFTTELLNSVGKSEFELHAYCTLSNHYHLIAEGEDPKQLRFLLGRLHGRTSRYWNQEDHRPGRKVWYRAFDKRITSNRQYYRTLNYIHHNPVKAGRCKRWTDWRWSSAKSFIYKIGRDKAKDIWRMYPP